MHSTAPQLSPAAEDASGPIDVGQVGLVVLDSLTEGVYVLDADWRIVFANDAFASHMDMAKDALMGRSLWDILPEAQHPLMQGAFGRVARTREAEAMVQHSLVHAGRTMDVRVFPVADGIGVVFRDITRRVTAERALATSEAHLRQALDGAAMGDWSWNAWDDAMTFSDRALALYGLGPESQGMTREALRRHMIHPDDIEQVREAAHRAHIEQTPYDVDYRVRRNGQWRWMRVMGGAHIVDGEIVGVHGLVQDIDDRKRANERLQTEIVEREKAQQRQQLLIHELNHRVKNILAMVQAMAAQTLSTAASPTGARIALEARLIALAQAHDVLTRESWDGAELSDIIAGGVAPHQSQLGERVHIQGPRVRLEPKTAVSLAMAVHELATNAVKYGALSNDEGFVTIDWTVEPVKDGCDLRLIWAEHGGPQVQPPTRTGFGSRLIGRSLASENGVATLSYPPQGARCDIAVVLPAL
jgi:PAS domain S-box-containing protein